MSVLDTLFVNRYANIAKPKVEATIPLSIWVNAIKNSAHSKKIDSARSSLDKIVSVKSNLPAVTYNFIYKNYKKDSNIVGSTGLMYFDLDGGDVDLSHLDLSKVLILNRSVSGYNYSLVVRVEGVTKENFNSVYLGISQDLGIYEMYDNAAKKYSQFTVLSYDADVYINEDPYIYKASDFCPQIAHTKEEERKTYISDMGANPYLKIRYNNLSDYKFDCDYIVNWSGFTYIQCFIPYRNKNINKYKTLLSYCTNLVWLNPHITYKRAYDILDKINIRSYEDPTSAVNIIKILDAVFKQLREGKLTPIVHVKKKKIIFDADNKSKLSTKDKNEIVIQLLAEKRREESVMKLGRIIDEWDIALNGKITVRSLSEFSDMNRKTIEKYYHLFKDVVKVKNN